MPIEMIEDLTPGKSWLSFARGSSAIDYEQGEYRKERKKYAGKTYDSVDSIAEFFKQRSQQFGQPSVPVGSDRWRGNRSTSNAQSPKSSDVPDGEFVPGCYVKHAKYGRGLVLRREGAGESTKLTVSFPGYGQKKLVQKYAGLEKA
jgi:DNA helicase-2/ATP-dependent DNA helicase PcrA